ncbi:MAG: hypothetical protein JNK48_05000 [Bryobacterales bacterium]|nr:hypothetical protein [Bryobacterales bacterium]
MQKFFVSLMLAAATLAAVETRFWQHYDPADYEKATLHKVSLRSDGRVSLAPVFQETFDTNLPFLWAVAEDSKGNVYSGGGAPGAGKAKLFQIDAAGKGKSLVEVDGAAIQSIAIDRQDRVYMATSPDGKVYRVTNGQASVFYDPKAKYIWSMAFDSRGNLFLATGDKGEIHRVTPSGQGQVFFTADETHVRSLAVDAKDNVIAGTEPGGVVIRVSPAGEGFVLYQSSKREITSIAVGKDGVLYVAAVGAKTAAVAPPPAPVPIPSPTPAGAAAPRPVAAPIPATLTAAPAISGGSEIWRIDADGAPSRVWQHGSELVYALALDAQGRLLLGTGNRGRIYRLEEQRMYSTLVNSVSTQITALALSRSGAVHVATANVGKVFRLGPELEKEGSLESEALDAGAFSYWGRARFEGDVPGGAVALETRSGNLDRPQKNWSVWSAVPFHSTNGRMASPAARFLQYRLKLTASANGASPNVSLLEFAYLTKNVAPVVDAIEPTPANYRFPAPSTAASTASPQSLTLPPMGGRRSGSSVSLDSGSSSMSFAKGHIGVRWRSFDDNLDNLLHKVEIRGAAEREWKLMKESIRERQYSWDSTTLPDGRYQVRVTASDSPSNPPAGALAASLESELFLIDNTPPLISALAATPAPGRLTVRWKAKDALSVIEKAEYSINGGEWMTALPVTRLADSLELDYAVEVPRAASGEITIAVRVSDEFENQSVDKVTVR